MTVQLTLSPSTTDIFELKAKQAGYDLSQYLKVTLDRIARVFENEKDKNIPVYKMSAKMEKRIEKDLKDYEAGKCRIITSVDDL